MTAFNASVTVTSDGRLTLGSMVTVEEDGATVACNEVPQRAPVGGVTFWNRVHAALGEVGWRVVFDTPFDESEPGVIRFCAELAPPR